MAEAMPDIPPGATIVHSPHGFIHLREVRADDLMVVNAARTSYAVQSHWLWDLDNTDTMSLPGLNEGDEGLIKFLMKNRHGTPFEQTFFQFHVQAPIFLFREWHRHRIGVSINESSGRYIQLKPDFYLPDDEHVRVQEGKPGHYKYVAKGSERIRGEEGLMTYGQWARDELREAYSIAYETYEKLLSEGVAKELARTCLPVGIYSQMVWSCNARSLMNFLSLRNHDRALRELRDYAAVMETLFVERMPVTAKAFIDNGRVAP